MMAGDMMDQVPQVICIHGLNMGQKLLGMDQRSNLPIRPPHRIAGGFGVTSNIIQFAYPAPGDA